MNFKKILKISGIVIGSLLVILVAITSWGYYHFIYSLVPEGEKFEHSADYINPEIALLNDGFEVCNENFILQYYNPERATYSKGKNELRKFVLSNYTNNNYTDSGYLNIRFVINCKGEAGRYIIHENNLDLEPQKFNTELVNQLFKITSNLKNWNPNFVRNEYRDSYMYLSYRIENGEITEIIP